MAPTRRWLALTAFVAPSPVGGVACRYLTTSPPPRPRWHRHLLHRRSPRHHPAKFAIRAPSSSHSRPRLTNATSIARRIAALRNSRRQVPFPARLMAFLLALALAASLSGRGGRNRG